MLNRREFCAAALAAGAGLASRRSRAAERTNILLITTDDLGCQLGCYGDHNVPTPNLDRLSDEGVHFTRAYVTQASCSPSRSSIFTGLYPHQSGQLGLSHRGYQMRDGIAAFPNLLQNAGYRNGVLGKIHVRPEPKFEMRQTNVKKTRDVKWVADEAGKFMAAEPDRPFFLMVNYFDPHRPLERQVNGLPAKPFEPDDVEPFPFLGLDAPKVRADVANYCNCVSRIDTGMGFLLDALEKSGQAENTLVIFLGDHGPPFTRSKTTCYEAGVQIPLLLRWPERQRAAVRSDGFVSTVDLMPTILEAAGVTCPDGLPGSSLVPWLSGGNPDWRDELATEYTSHHQGGYYPRRAVRTDRYKLIANLLQDRPNPIKGVDGCAAWAAAQDPKYDDAAVRRIYETYTRPPAEEFYDLSADPHEFVNLASDPAHQAALAELRGRLDAWRRRTADPALDPNQLAALTRQHDHPKP